MRLKNNGYLFGGLSGLTWGLDSVLIGIVLSMVPFIDNPILAIGGVFVCSMLHDSFAALWMFVLQLTTGEIKEFKKAILSRDAMFCCFGALLGGPLAMSCYMYSIKTAGPALTAVVTACYPILGSLLAVWILKEKMSLRGWGGLLLCLGGVLLLGYTPDNQESSSVSLGILLSCITAIGWASEGVVCGYGMKSGVISPRMALFLRELTSSIAYILVALPLLLGGYTAMFNSTIEVLKTPSTTLFIAATALVGMASFLMWYTAINKIGAAKALCLNITYAFWAIIFAAILTEQKITVKFFVGAGLILGGVILSTLLTKNEQ